MASKDTSSNDKGSEVVKDKDPAYFQVLSRFEKLCHDLSSLGSSQQSSAYSDIKANQSLVANSNRLDNDLLYLCAQLSFWIYTPNDPNCPLPDKSNFFEPEITLTGSKQVSQWAFVISKSNVPCRRAFLVFKGTDADRVFDMIVDSGVVPLPIIFDDCMSADIVTQSDRVDTLLDGFSVHSGMYASVMRDYRAIRLRIEAQRKLFDQLIICGHSLGGGLSMLFALRSLMSGHILPPMTVVTFGSPPVIAIENGWDRLSPTAKRHLKQLKEISHCIINRLDPIPRLPANKEWTTGVVPYALKKIVSDQLLTTFKLPKIVLPFVKTGVKSGVSKFVEYVEKYEALLHTYRQLGHMYFFTSDLGEPPIITSDPLIVDEIMSFTPPFKIIAPTGEEVRVQHKATHSRYSTSISDGMNSIDLASLLYIENSDKLLSENLEQSHCNDNLTEDESHPPVSVTDKSAPAEPGAPSEEKRKQLERAKSIQSDFNKMEIVEDHELKDTGYTELRLSSTGWMTLVQNHLMHYYIELFSAKLQKPAAYDNIVGSQLDANQDYFAAPDSVEKKEAESHPPHPQSKDALLIRKPSVTDDLKSTAKTMWTRKLMDLKKSTTDGMTVAHKYLTDLKKEYGDKVNTPKSPGEEGGPAAMNEPQLQPQPRAQSQSHPQPQPQPYYGMDPNQPQMYAQPSYPQSYYPPQYPPPQQYPRQQCPPQQYPPPQFGNYNVAPKSNAPASLYPRLPPKK